MIRIEIEVSVPQTDLQTVLMRAAQSLDLGDGAVVHRMTAEEADA